MEGDSLFRKCMHWICLAVAQCSMIEGESVGCMRAKKGQSSRSFISLHCSRKAPALKKIIFYIGSSDPLSPIHAWALLHTQTHRHTPPHACTWCSASVKGKRTHLEKSSCGSRRGALQELVAFALTLVERRLALWLPRAHSVASDNGCSTSW